MERRYGTGGQPQSLLSPLRAIEADLAVPFSHKEYAYRRAITKASAERFVTKEEREAEEAVWREKQAALDARDAILPNSDGML